MISFYRNGWTFLTNVCLLNFPKLVKAVELLVESRTSSAEASALQLLTEREHELQAQDRQERDRIDSKNALEEFVLAIRGRIHDDQDLAPYLEPATRDQLARLSDDTENWLYDDGEDCEKALYTQKLQEVTPPSSLSILIGSSAANQTLSSHSGSCSRYQAP